MGDLDNKTNRDGGNDSASIAGGQEDHEDMPVMRREFFWIFCDSVVVHQGHGV
jgi:hypothetical protein